MVSFVSRWPIVANFPVGQGLQGVYDTKPDYVLQVCVQLNWCFLRLQVSNECGLYIFLSACGTPGLGQDKIRCETNSSGTLLYVTSGRTAVDS